MDFFESWLPHVLKMTTMASRIKLERAHRNLATKPDHPNRNHRTLMLRFHAFRDKQRVMEAARRASQNSGIIYYGSRISLYSDFSLTVMKKRKAYDAIKERLRERGLQYALLFLAPLQVMHRGSKKRFSTPEEARTFNDSLPV